MDSSEKVISMVIDEYDVIEEPMLENNTFNNEQQQENVPVIVNESTVGSGQNESTVLRKSETAPGGDNPTTDRDFAVIQGTVKQPDITDTNTKDTESGKSRGLQEEEPALYELLCPRVNCPEKIILCLDFSSEMDKPMFRTRAGDKFTPMKLVKRALGFFIHSKHRIDPRHQFALVLMQESALWVRDFTRDPRELVNLLEDLEDTSPCERCDLSSLFQCVYDRVTMPTVEGDPMVLPPPYTARVLMIYGRSHCLLELPHKEAQRALFSSPYFFVDAFYIHETPSEDNKCEEIFDSLCDLDHKGFSYIFEASRNPTKIYDFMAQLLAHPLQRPGQKEVSCKIRAPATAEQMS